MEKTEKYFSEPTIEFLSWAEQVRDVSRKFFEDIESGNDPDDIDLSFLYGCYSTMI